MNDWVSDRGRSRDLSLAHDSWSCVLLGSKHGCYKRSAYILLMSNAIDMISLVCSLYLCRITCAPHLSTVELC